MIKTRLPILPFLALWILLASSAYSAEWQSPASEENHAPEAVVAMKLASPGMQEDDSLLHSMMQLLDSDVEYTLNDSASVVVACNPFESQETDTHIYHPISNISVGLKISF